MTREVFLAKINKLVDTLPFGIEIELTGHSRGKATKIISSYFDTIGYYLEGTDDECTLDSIHGTWSVLRGSSIIPLKKVGEQIIPASDAYKVKIVSPFLTNKRAFDDMQGLLRKLDNEGFFPSDTCTLRVYVNVKELPIKTLYNLCSYVSAKQELFFKAFGISSDSQRYSYCKALPEELFRTFKSYKPKTLEGLAKIWFDVLSDSRGAYRQYDRSTYYILNLSDALVPDSDYYTGNIKYGGFTPTMDGEKIYSYAQFFLLLIANCAVKYKVKPDVYKVRYGVTDAWCLHAFLHSIGGVQPRYKTMRKYLFENFKGQVRGYKYDDSQRLIYIQ